MAQDFAKKTGSASKNNKRKPSKSATRNTQEPGSHWSWFFSGLFSGLMLCIIGYLGITGLNNKGPSTDLFDAVQTEDNNIQDSAGADLEFYDYLPQAEVEVSVVPVEIASGNTGGQELNPINYLLQAGSFQSRDDADELRARIILLNLDARIQPVSLSGRTWFRVQAGPFLGRNSVEIAEKTLIENNIDPIRLRIPSE